MERVNAISSPINEQAYGGVALRAADHAALATLRSARVDARHASDERPPLAVLAGLFAELRVPAVPPRPSHSSVRDARDEWLRRIRSAGRSDSSIRAYRNAIDDLLAWAADAGRADELFEERTVVDYLDAHQQRGSPAPATYHRRLVLLRRFVRWLSQRASVTDPFLNLEAPPKPRQEGDWLAPQEFSALLTAAQHLPRRVPGLVERDRLVLLALVTTGLRRAELIALDRRDLVLDGTSPSLLVRRGKGAKPRRQPLAAQLAAELRDLERERCPASDDPVFCGLRGGRLQPTILADMIARNARRAQLTRRVTGHTLRHTAATWLRQETADVRLVAEYLGNADLSTVNRYAHVATAEMHSTAQTLGARAGLERDGDRARMSGTDPDHRLAACDRPS
jgi:integrase/recombinase XerC